MAIIFSFDHSKRYYSLMKNIEQVFSDLEINRRMTDDVKFLLQYHLDYKDLDQWALESDFYKSMKKWKNDVTPKQTMQLMRILAPEHYQAEVNARLHAIFS